jgi:hypothetical protein
MQVRAIKIERSHHDRQRQSAPDPTRSIGLEFGSKFVTNTPPVFRGVPNDSALIEFNVSIEFN